MDHRRTSSENCGPHPAKYHRNAVFVSAHHTGGIYKLTVSKWLVSFLLRILQMCFVLGYLFSDILSRAKGNGYTSGSQSRTVLICTMDGGRDTAKHPTTHKKHSYPLQNCLVQNGDNAEKPWLRVLPEKVSFTMQKQACLPAHHKLCKCPNIRFLSQNYVYRPHIAL